MSDYMFKLESHLTPAQSQVVAAVQTAALENSVALYLTGGAMRDMLGGFPIRDLDFRVEGNPVPVAKSLAKTAAATIVSTDTLRKAVELRFPDGTTAEVSMSRRETFSKPGAKPRIAPAGIHDDLHCRDFTINSIALSLSKASRGLLLDPNNGIGDLVRHELRTVTNYTLFDDPARILRLNRFRVRFGFTIEDKTLNQYNNVREAGLESKILPENLSQELRLIAGEPDPAGVVRMLEQENLLGLFSAALNGNKLPHASLQKLHKVREIIPFGSEFHAEPLGLFLHCLCEILTPKERKSFIKNSGLDRAAVSLWQKLEGRAQKLQRVLKSAKLAKPSQVYSAIFAAPGDEVLFLLMKSDIRLVVDRIKNYFGKYIAAAQEVTDADIVALGLTPGTPKFAKVKKEKIQQRLDARPRKAPPVPEPPPPPPPPPYAMARGRGPGRPPAARPNPPVMPAGVRASAPQVPVAARASSPAPAVAVRGGFPASASAGRGRS